MIRGLRRMLALLVAPPAIWIAAAVWTTAAIWITPASALSLQVESRVQVGREPIGLAMSKEGRIFVVSAQDRTLIEVNPGVAIEPFYVFESQSDISYPGAPPPLLPQMRITRRLDLGAHGRLNSVILGLDGRALYVSASIAGEVLRIDAARLEIDGEIGGLSFPQTMVIDGSSLFVVNTGARSLSKIDLPSFSIVALLKAGDRPQRVRLDDTNGRIIVLNSLGRSIRFYRRVAKHEVSGQLRWSTLARPQDVAVVPNGDLWVVDASQDKILILGPDDEEPARDIPLMSDRLCATCGAVFVPMVLALSPDQAYAVVAGRGGNLAIIDVANERLVALAPVGRDLRDVAFSPGGRIYVTSFGTGELVAVRIVGS